MLVKPLGWFVQRGYVMGLSFPYASHGDHKENGGGKIEQHMAEVATGNRFDRAEDRRNDDKGNVQPERLRGVKTNFHFLTRNQEQLD